jgi:hypothetical protein
VLHAGDVEVRGVLEELAKLVTTLAGVHQVVEAPCILSEGANILLWLFLHLLIDIRHDVSY